MPLRKHLLPTALFLAACPALAPAVDYYVDGQSPSASDADGSTTERPFKTIGAAAAKAQAGDTVVVRPGLYRESVVLKNSGKPGAPIVFKSEAKHAAVVSGADRVTEWREEGPGVWSMSDPDLKKMPHDNPVYGNGQWVYVHDCPLLRADTRAQLAPGGFCTTSRARKSGSCPTRGRTSKRSTSSTPTATDSSGPRGRSTTSTSSASSSSTTTAPRDSAVTRR
jgi:hypothetical protein